MVLAFLFYFYFFFFFVNSEKFTNKKERKCLNQIIKIHRKFVEISAVCQRLISCFTLSVFIGQLWTDPCLSKIDELFYLECLHRSIMKWSSEGHPSTTFHLNSVPRRTHKVCCCLQLSFNLACYWGFLWVKLNSYQSKPIKALLHITAKTYMYITFWSWTISMFTLHCVANDICC